MWSCNIDKYSQLNKSFKIIAFDWDGTAVVNRKADASLVTRKLEELLKLGIYIVVITGTNLGNIDKQFSSFIKGEHKQNLYVLTNRGSESYGFNCESNSIILYKRVADEEENKLLDKVVDTVKEKIENSSNIKVNITYDRLNRRKLDLIPEWKNPGKHEIDKLLIETQNRLIKGGFAGGINKAFKLMLNVAKSSGLTKAKITSDVKHLEVGLTDKSDSIWWMINQVARINKIPNEQILIGGDEFGSIAGFEGSDSKMILSNEKGITYFSVGIEPNGTPEPVINLGGGPDCFIRLLEKQIQLSSDSH
jgi:hydroxymethylpyrimidine pyrophosphatase-like HAD family hydrolase